jgi:predicted amidohydrolase
MKVAAVQYSEGYYNKVDPACGSDENPDLCAINKLIAKAQAQGAALVVTPENEVGQKYLEDDPQIGDLPATSSTWSDDEIIKVLSKQAIQQKLYIVSHLQTLTGTGSNVTKYSTQVAFDPSGKVVGKHHKFELYGGEKDVYTPGKSVDLSWFNSPAGKVGMLICADTYGDLRMHDKLTRVLGARLVAFSSWWTVAEATRWPASYAKNWGVYVVAANRVSGSGKGGGIFDPAGKALVKHTSSDPGVIIAEIPATP